MIFVFGIILLSVLSIIFYFVIYKTPGAVDKVSFIFLNDGIREIDDVSCNPIVYKWDRDVWGKLHNKTLSDYVIGSLNGFGHSIILVPSEKSNFNASVKLTSDGILILLFDYNSYQSTLLVKISDNTIGTNDKEGTALTYDQSTGELYSNNKRLVVGEITNMDGSDKELGIVLEDRNKNLTDKGVWIWNK